MLDVPWVVHKSINLFFKSILLYLSSLIFNYLNVLVFGGIQVNKIYSVMVLIPSIFWENLYYFRH